jgi:hypothetical protein
MEKIKMEFKIKHILALAVSSLILTSCSKNYKFQPPSERARPKNCKIYINKKTGKGTCNPIGYEDQSDVDFSILKNLLNT